MLWVRALPFHGQQRMALPLSHQAHSLSLGLQMLAPEFRLVPGLTLPWAPLGVRKVSLCFLILAIVCGIYSSSSWAGSEHISLHTIHTRLLGLYSNH